MNLTVAVAAYARCLAVAQLALKHMGVYASGPNWYMSKAWCIHWTTCMSFDQLGKAGLKSLANAHRPRLSKVTKPQHG